MGDSGSVNAAGYGFRYLPLRDLLLHLHCWYVPGMPINLLSVSQLHKSGFRSLFDEHMEIMDKQNATYITLVP